jgi:hypothetical protein
MASVCSSRDRQSSGGHEQWKSLRNSAAADHLGLSGGRQKRDFGRRGDGSSFLGRGGIHDSVGDGTDVQDRRAVCLAIVGLKKAGDSCKVVVAAGGDCPSDGNASRG